MNLGIDYIKQVSSYGIKVKQLTIKSFLCYFGCLLYDFAVSKDDKMFTLDTTVAQNTHISFLIGFLHISMSYRYSTTYHYASNVYNHLFIDLGCISL